MKKAFDTVGEEHAILPFSRRSENTDQDFTMVINGKIYF